MLLDIDVAVRQPLALTVPIASPVLTVPTVSTVPIVSPVLTVPIVSTVPIASPVLTVPTVSTIPKQLSLDRPEVLIQAYLAENITWLAQHPTVRPTEYRKARKWKTLRPKVLKEQVFYIPKERRDLKGNIIANKANWTPEETTV